MFLEAIELGHDCAIAVDKISAYSNATTRAFNDPHNLPVAGGGQPVGTGPRFWGEHALDDDLR